MSTYVIWDIGRRWAGVIARTKPRRLGVWLRTIVRIHGLPRSRQLHILSMAWGGG